MNEADRSNMIGSKEPCTSPNLSRTLVGGGRALVCGWVDVGRGCLPALFLSSCLTCLLFLLLLGTVPFCLVLVSSVLLEIGVIRFLRGRSVILIVDFLVLDVKKFIY